LSYHENAYDPAAKKVLQERVYAAEMVRPLTWGMTGRLGYSIADSLIDPSQRTRLLVGLSGENHTVGRLDLEYEAGRLHTASGSLADGSRISASVSRRIGVADVSLSGKRTVPPGASARAQHEVKVDLTAEW
jgi:hypothetical protein